jgi:hypothetical protein
VPLLAGPLPTWGPDAVGSAGLAVGVLVIWLGWRLGDWGPLVPEFCLLLVAVTVPHLVVTPLWDVSTHVLYAAVPAGYATLVDRRFAPLAVVALGMVFARPLAGAHTWPQAVGGLVLAAAFLAAAAVRREPTATARGER